MPALALSALLAGCVEGQFFYPDDRVWSTPQQLGVRADDVTIATPDGLRLHGWWLPAEGAAKGNVLHLHGNAANVSNHLPLVAWLPAAGWNVLMLDYRGFGRSAGRPTLDGVVVDARAALAWLRARTEGSIVVLGQSLGGATALRAVAGDAERVKLVVVDSAFASYRGIARDVLGDALGWLVSPALGGLPGAEADPVKAIAVLGVPVFVLHGSADAVIPFAHGQALYAAAGEPRQWLEVQAGSHLEALMREPVRRHVLDAMQRAVAP